MTTLYTLFPQTALDEAINNRHVVRRFHPTLPLAILNYTDVCQYERGLWTEVTRQCRGIIYNTDTLEVVARPFRKFFNYGQAEAPTLELTDNVVVTDKIDGSLGILYPTPDGHAVATRGSFDSDQALHATAVWKAKYEGRVDVPTHWTMLFEIVYPENRIVCDYGDTDDLVLLGAVHIKTGASGEPGLIGPTWTGPRTTVYSPYATFGEALAAPPRPNAEGLVIHHLASGARVKIKQDDYVRLHRLVTGLNERVVWEHLSERRPLDQLITPLPDEFHDWVVDVAARLCKDVDNYADDIEAAYENAVERLPVGYTRKDFALAIKDLPPDLKAGVFARLDGKDYRPMLWKLVRPEGNRNAKRFSEDTA